MLDILRRLRSVRVTLASIAVALATTGGTFTEYTHPHAEQRTASIMVGPDGALWFTEQFGFNIGRITTSGQITEYALPTHCASRKSSRPDRTARCGSPRCCRIRRSAASSGASPPAAASTGTTRASRTNIRLRHRSRAGRQDVVRAERADREHLDDRKDHAVPTAKSVYPLRNSPSRRTARSSSPRRARAVHDRRHVALRAHRRFYPVPVVKHGRAATFVAMGPNRRDVWFLRLKDVSASSTRAGKFTEFFVPTRATAYPSPRR